VKFYNTQKTYFVSPSYKKIQLIQTDNKH